MASEMISDNDIRKQLKSFGVEIGPVTDASIRKIYLKKLEKLKNSEKQPSGNSRPVKTGRTNNSEAEDSVPNQDNTPRRRSTRRSLPQPSPRSRRSIVPTVTDESDDFVEDSDDQLPPSKVSTPSRAPKTTASVNGKKEMPPPSSANLRRRSTAHTSEMASSSKGRRSIASPIVNGTTGGPSTITRTIPSDPPPSDHKHLETQPWSKWMPGKKWFSNGSHHRTNGDEDHLEVSDADFSDSEHIASKMSTNVNSSRNHRDAQVLTSPGLLFSPPSSPVFQASEIAADTSNSYNPGISESWTRHIPNLLLVGLLLLVLGVFAVYVVRKDQHLTDLKKTELKKLICNSANTADGSVCYQEKNLNTAVNYTVYLYDLLSQHAYQYYCEKTDLKNTSLAVGEAKRSLSAVLHPIPLDSQHWTIILHIIHHMGYQHYNLASYDSEGVLLSADKQPTEAAFLECRKPHLPISCRVIWRFHRTILLVNGALHWLVDCLAIVLSLIAGLGLLALLALFGYKIRSYLRVVASRKREEITDVVISISRLLQDKLRDHEKDKTIPQYIPSDKIRNTISQSNEKVLNDKFWASVCRHIYDFETSIDVQDRRGSGEVWYWKGGSGWQGSALPDRAVKLPFETPPTECLKIRNMFFKSAVDNDLRQRLTREILKKCGDIGEILHVGIDAQGEEGMVYILCDSRSTAGKAYREIYANYFDGKLVTVKFLRVDKYFKRFPEASECRHPLRIDLTRDDYPI